jgi:hypothetical protein
MKSSPLTFLIRRVQACDVHITSLNGVSIFVLYAHKHA